MVKIVKNFKEYKENLDYLKFKLISAAINVDGDNSNWWQRNRISLIFITIVAILAAVSYVMGWVLALRIVTIVIFIQLLSIVISTIKNIIAKIKRK